MVEGYTKSVRFEDGMKFENQNRGAYSFNRLSRYS